MVQTRHMMNGGAIVDATIINIHGSTQNAAKSRDHEVHRTKNGSEWKLGMRRHIGINAGSGLAHTITVTSANQRDVTEIGKPLRKNGKVV